MRRRYSDFEWLRNELERDSKVSIIFNAFTHTLLLLDNFKHRNFNIFLFQIVVPPLPGKAWKRQMPFRGDDGIFEEDFIEDRRKGLEVFVNK